MLLRFTVPEFCCIAPVVFGFWFTTLGKIFPEPVLAVVDVLVVPDAAMPEVVPIGAAGRAAAF